jgi:hypothetical protein
VPEEYPLHCGMSMGKIGEKVKKNRWLEEK